MLVIGMDARRLGEDQSGYVPEGALRFLDIDILAVPPAVKTPDQTAAYGRSP